MGLEFRYNQWKSICSQLGQVVWITMIDSDSTISNKNHGTRTSQYKEFFLIMKFIDIRVSYKKWILDYSFNPKYIVRSMLFSHHHSSHTWLL